MTAIASELLVIRRIDPKCGDHFLQPTCSVLIRLVPIWITSRSPTIQELGAEQQEPVPLRDIARHFLSLVTVSGSRNLTVSLRLERKSA